MDTMVACVVSQAAGTETFNVFDWVKAARIINERRVDYAEAGLSEDLDWTAGTILSNGKPVPEHESGVYLQSNWATPVLILEGEEIECYVTVTKEEMLCRKNANNGKYVYWPKEALDELDTVIIDAEARDTDVSTLTFKK